MLIAACNPMLCPNWGFRPCEKLIFELDRSRTPSPKLASVLVRMGEGFYQAGYASSFRRTGPSSTVSTKVDYVCTVP